MYGILFVLFLTIYAGHSEVIYTYEFERAVGGAGKSRSPWRSRASEISALHVFKGDVVEMKLCLNQETEIYIAGLEYSNDGVGDNIVFEIDGRVIGKYYTESTLNGWGHLWNNHKMTGRIGNQFPLTMGTHVFRIKAESTDCYGTEFDRLKLASSRDTLSNFFCGVILVQSKQPTPCAVQLDSMFPTAIPTTTVSIPSTTRAPLIVEQLSFESSCLDHHNVFVKFHAESLKGTEIITKSTPNPNRKPNNPSSVKANHVKGHSCDTIIWQIGEYNERNNELGPIWPDNHIDFDVNSHVHDHQYPFPKEVDPNEFQQILLRYVVPKQITLKGGQVRFTVGLINVSESINVGLQYFMRHKKDPSGIKNITFTNFQKVMGWILPVRAISPSLENQLALYFDEKSTQIIKIDFLRLEYIPPTRRPLLLSRTGLWKIQGKQLHRNGGGALRRIMTSGMQVIVNGIKRKEEYENVYILRKPNFKVLTIYRNGEIYPKHETRITKRSQKSYHKLHDVTGITLGAKEVSLLDIDTYSGFVTVTYNDTTAVKLSFGYSKTLSLIRIEYVRMNPDTLTFFSTYISPVSSAIDELTVDNTIHKHIMDPDISGLTGSGFKFENNAHNPLFSHVSDVYEIKFSL